MSTVYCQAAEIKDLVPEASIIQLLNDANESLVFEDVVSALEGIINDAEKKINSYLLGKFTTPITPVPDIINNICKNITRYFLYDRRSQGIPDNVRDSYKDALKDLNAIAIGEIDLGTGTQTEDFFFLSNKKTTDATFVKTGQEKSTTHRTYNLDNY